MKMTFSEKLKSLFSKNTVLSSSFFEDFADTLIEGDLGAKDSFEITDLLEQSCKKENITDHNKPKERTAMVRSNQYMLQSPVLSDTLYPSIYSVVLFAPFHIFFQITFLNIFFKNLCLQIPFQFNYGQDS